MERRAPPRVKRPLPAADDAGAAEAAAFGATDETVREFGVSTWDAAGVPLGGIAKRPSRARTLGCCSAMFCASEKSDDVSI